MGHATVEPAGFTTAWGVLLSIGLAVGKILEL